MNYFDTKPFGTMQFLGTMVKEHKKEEKRAKKAIRDIKLTQEEFDVMSADNPDLTSPHAVSAVTKFFYVNSEDELWMQIVEKFANYKYSKKVTYAKSLRDDLDLFKERTEIRDIIKVLEAVFDQILIEAGQSLAKKNTHQVKGIYGVFILDFIEGKEQVSKKKIVAAYVRKMKGKDKKRSDDFYKKAIARTLNELIKKGVLVREEGKREIFDISEFTYKEDSKWLYIKEDLTEEDTNEDKINKNQTISRIINRGRWMRKSVP